MMGASTITCAACKSEFPILRFIDKHLEKIDNQFLESDRGDKLIKIKHISDLPSAGSSN